MLRWCAKAPAAFRLLRLSYPTNSLAMIFSPINRPVRVMSSLATPISHISGAKR